MNSIDEVLRARLGPIDAGWPETPLRHAAVLCPIVEVRGADHLVLILRHEGSSQHAGQMAFPGGMRQGDETPLATALRECHEEIGAGPDAVTVFGSLNARESSSGSLVHCVVGRLQPVALRADPREVARILHVPLAELQDPARWQHRTPPPTASGKQPPTSPHFECGPDLLWGLTARFACDLLAVLRAADHRVC